MDVLEKDRRYLMQVYSPESVVIDRGNGMYLYDKAGKGYLDFSAQFSSCSLGHAHPELLAAIGEQLRKSVSVTSMFLTEERAALAETLAELAPSGLEKVLLGCTGSDANEFALKLAKYYKGGGKIISFRRGFHGSTAGSAAATGKSETIQENASISELLPNGFLHSSPPYCYRCDFRMTPQSCGLQGLHYLEQTILHEGGDKVAAVMMEPVFAAGGVIVPPEGFLKGLRRLCDQYDALLIFDEVVTGFGQTGSMFACQQWDVTPDILVTGKALTGGYIPGSAVIARRDIGEAADALSLHGHTHSGYPLMCAAALKNIEIIRRNGLCEQASAVGKYLLEELARLQGRFAAIGDVRGRGLLVGFELVKDRGTKEADFELARNLFETMLAKGLITELESRKNLQNAVIVLHPPLITERKHVEEAVGIIEEALAECIGKKAAQI
jgi:4-aminobutyrate aminotransferase-like enzyme